MGFFKCFNAGKWAILPYVTIISPDWFDHLRERICYIKFPYKPLYSHCSVVVMKLPYTLCNSYKERQRFVSTRRLNY